GLVESAAVGTLLALVLRESDPGAAVAMLLALPGLVLLVLPGLGRAFGALFLRETGGSGPVVLAFETMKALGAWHGRRDRSFVPLTREAFWERLGRPDAVEAEPEGTLVFRGLLPHLTWTRSRRLEAEGDFWGVEPRPPAFERGRLLHAYRLAPLGEPPSPGAPPPSPPPPTAYADEVMAGVRQEWDALNTGFSWLTSMLSADVQARAFGHRGGPSVARRPTLVTAFAGGVLGLYVLRFLPGPPGDPLAPYLGGLAVALVVDTVRRVRATRRGEYAPSLFRWLLPSEVLRPERLAYHAHRDAEREALLALDRTPA
ncbi:MAG TPA: hypothetical protein VGB87_21270, partial [Vicinamibacteria bacterium]